MPFNSVLAHIPSVINLFILKTSRQTVAHRKDKKVRVKKMVVNALG